jgi:amino acid adenylation domain-containing protein
VTQRGFVFPLSFAQSRLWFLDQLAPGDAAYNVVGAVRVRGPLDVEALRAALGEIMRRHEALRTTFASVGGEPVQVIAPEGRLGLEVEPISAKELEQRLGELAREPFDLRTGPLVRARLLELGEHEHVLVLGMHHIVSDGWSLGVMLRETSTLYQAFSSGEPSPLADPEIQYADYAHWQRDRYDRGELNEQLNYWRTHLADAPPALELPTDHPRSPLDRGHGAQHPIEIDTDQLDALRALSREHGATLYMTLLAALQTLLSRISGQHDILVGSPIAGRTRAELENLIGFFVNTLVIRADLSENPTFAELLARVRESSLDAYTNQEVPFEKLVETLAPHRDLTHTPLFSVMFVLQNAPTTPFTLPNTQIEPLPITTNTAKFDLTLSLQEDTTGLHGYLEYNEHLFNTTTAHRLATTYKTILKHILTNPHQPTATIPLLTPTERHHLLTHTNNTHTPIPNLPIHTLYEHQATKTPNATALITEEGELKYWEVNSAANRLARHLRSRGAHQEATVAILIEPSAEMLIALLAVLKTGAAFLPIDPATPPERIEYLLDHAGASAVLTTSEYMEQLPRSGVEALALDDASDALLQYGDANLELAVELSSRAYTIYTSGSTGRPKGVAVEHRNILSYLSAITARLGLEPGWSYAMVQPLAVDACMTVLVPAICTGGTLHVLRRASATEPDAVVAHFSRHKVDVLKIAPSHLAALLDARPSSQLLPHRVLILGGEASSRAWVETKLKPLAHPDCRMFVHYGPTETTVGVLTHPIERQSPSQSRFEPIGRPLPNARVYVLDQLMELLPVGVVGEIWIGGASVARGYVDLPVLTAERFLPDPFAEQPGGRLYRSGDLGRQLASGDIEFLGRVDRQVKVRGYRVELSEVEAVLEEHPAVKQVTVVARRDATAGVQLAAYVVPERERAERTSGEHVETLPSRVRAHARQRLPDYMVPSAVRVLDALPLNAHGKLDVRRLPDPLDGAATRADRRAPRTLLEARLATIWEEVLEIGPIGVDDDFFELGGHSLLAVRMMALVRKRIGRSAPLAALFGSPTVADLAQLLHERAAEADDGVLVALQAGDTDPLFCVHPIGGDVLCYAELARALGPRRPVFGIRAIASDDPPASIEAMAAHYVEEVRRTARSGPYLLAGWSMGGLVAFEMARQLVAAGHEVGMLALLDTHLPPHQREAIPGHDDIPALARFAFDLARVAGVDLIGLRGKFEELDRDGQLEMVCEVLEREGLLADDTTRDEVMRRLDVFERNAAAVAAFTVRRFATHVIFLGAAETGAPASLAREWELRSGANVALHVVPGDHYGLLAREHVRVVADLLGQHMDGAGDRLPGSAVVEAVR